MTACRIHEWDEVLLHEEWAMSIPREVRFTGLYRFDRAVTNFTPIAKPIAIVDVTAVLSPEEQTARRKERNREGQRRYREKHRPVKPAKPVLSPEEQTARRKERTREASRRYREKHRLSPEERAARRIKRSRDAQRRYWEKQRAKVTA